LNLLEKLPVIPRALRPLVRFITDARRYFLIDKHILQLLPLLHNQRNLDNDVILDLGANRGDFSKWALRKGAHVYAFEPNGIATKYLAKRLLSYPKLHLLQAAVSNRNGIEEFFLHPNSEKDPLGYSIRGSLKQMEDDFKPSNSCLVLNLSDLLNVFPRVKVIKIDVEGAELEIWPILRERWSQIEFLLVEVHDSINPGLRTEMTEFIKSKKLDSKWSIQWN
jgi:FkbM family methyltransferase